MISQLRKQLLDALKLNSLNVNYQQKHNILEPLRAIKNEREQHQDDDDDDDRQENQNDHSNRAEFLNNLRNEFQKRASYKNNQKLAFQGLIGKLQSSG